MWTIYTKDGCSHCTKAMNLLSKSGIKYKQIKVTDKNNKKIYNLLDSKTKSYRYFPIIFHGKNFIGGYTELQNLFAPQSTCVLL